MSKLKYEPGERIFPRLADIESETYLEYYEDESQTKDDLKKSLESKKGEVIKMVEELRKMGISYDKILSKIKSLGKNHSTNVWYFGQPAPDAPTGHGSGYYEGDDERKIKKHENCSWTLDIIKDMKKLSQAEKMLKTEYSYKRREEEKGDLPELDDGIKQTIYQYLKGMKKKSKKKSKKKTKKKSKKENKRNLKNNLKNSY